MPGVPEGATLPPGETFNINGKSIELYGIGVLAEVLNRKPVTIRKWERDGVLPRATYAKSGANKDPRGRRRMYSREQVEAVVRVAREEGILHNLNAQVSKSQFTTKVFAAFKELAKR